MTRIRLQIDSVTTDGAHLSREELKAALRRELSELPNSFGSTVSGQGGSRDTARAELTGKGRITSQIASATVGAIKR